MVGEEMRHRLVIAAKTTPGPPPVMTVNRSAYAKSITY